MAPNSPAAEKQLQPGDLILEVDQKPVTTPQEVTDIVTKLQQQKKIIVFRPLFAVGGQELGYLPGDQAEKMNPWGQAVFDTLGALVSDNVMNEVVDRGILEVLPLTHIRGRSLHDAFVIVDEAQALLVNLAKDLAARGEITLTKNRADDELVY